MSLTAIALNGLLAILLLIALAFGVRLERRLKALRDSHDGFAKAVADLDRAAMRAEQGLADLRAATDEAADTLADRIAKAQALAVQLDERLNRPMVTPPPMSPSRASSPRPAAEPPTGPRGATRPMRAAEPDLPPQPPRRLRAEDFEKLLDREDRIPRDARPPSAARPAAPKETPRSRTRIDDDLFEGPEDPPRPGSTFRGRR